MTNAIDPRPRRINLDHNSPRAHSIRARNDYTDTLKAHGVEERGYMDCTEGIYTGLFGRKSHEIRQARGLGPRTNVRDHLPEVELILVAAAEALGAERIRHEKRVGNGDCALASYLSASNLRKAVEADRQSRSPAND
ncbi:hypothetical protein [Novosphingobium sp.]|uniref:hypothetical protein n=1 Tax=Novosphingobium sp. TaxID=1874826 RepID=UPI003BAD4AC1